MSSKKQPPKKKSVPEKKNVKKVGSAQKSASSAKKNVSSKKNEKAVTKAAPVKKSAASASKTASSSAKKTVPAKKTQVKKEIAKQAAVKTVKKSAAKSTKKIEKGKPESPKAVKTKNGTKKEEMKVVLQTSEKSAVSKPKKPVETKNGKVELAVTEAPGKNGIGQAKPVDSPKTNDGAKSGSGSAGGNKIATPSNAKKTQPVVQDDAILLQNGSVLAKSAFFIIDAEQEDKASRKKGPTEEGEKPTVSMRHRASLVDETPEELYARVIAELQEENIRFTQECSRQLCTKCCRNPVSPEYRVDKDLGYCEECAEILGLGRSKEARHLSYQAKLLGADSLDEARDDDDFGEAPSQEEIDEADKDLDLDDSDMDKL